MAPGEDELTDPHAGACEQHVPCQHAVVGPQRKLFSRQANAIGGEGAGEEVTAIEANQVMMVQIVLYGGKGVSVG